MADSSKTEKATPKKRRDERKKGNVFFSNDAVSVAVLLASFFVLKLTATPMVEQIYRFLQYAMGLVAGAAHTGLQDNLSGLVLEMLKTFLFAAGPLLATTAVVAVAATFFQTKLLVSGEALKPKFSRINPLQGIKRLFSLRSVIEALKGILKITVLLFLIYQFLVGIVDTFTKYLHTDLAVACAHLVDEGFQMVMQIAIAFVLGEEQTRRLYDVLGTYLVPLQVCGILLGGYADDVAVDDELALLHVVVDRTVETAVYRVVLEHVSHVDRKSVV